MKKLFMLVVIATLLTFGASAYAGDWIDQVKEHHGKVINLKELRGKWDEHGKLLLMATTRSGECWQYVAVKQDVPEYDYENEYVIIIFKKCGDEAWIKWEDRQL